VHIENTKRLLEKEEVDSSWNPKRVFFDIILKVYEESIEMIGRRLFVEFC